MFDVGDAVVVLPCSVAPWRKPEVESRSGWGRPKVLYEVPRGQLQLPVEVTLSPALPPPV